MIQRSGQRHDLDHLGLWMFMVWACNPIGPLGYNIIYTCSGVEPRCPPFFWGHIPKYLW